MLYIVIQDFHAAFYLRSTKQLEEQEKQKAWHCLNNLTQTFPPAKKNATASKFISASIKVFFFVMKKSKRLNE